MKYFLHRMRVKETQEVPWCVKMTMESHVLREWSVGEWDVPQRVSQVSTPMSGNTIAGSERKQCHNLNLESTVKQNRVVQINFRLDYIRAVFSP